MFLNKRSSDILTMLVRNPHYKISDLEKEFDLTKRQINYSLNKANQWLEDNHLPTVKRNKKGSFCIPEKTLQYFSGFTLEQQVLNFRREYILTEKDRVILLIYYLLIKTEEISLAHIVDILEVSKNTVVNDIKVANKWLENYNIKIVYSRMHGYDLEGKELSIRRFINRLLEELLSIYGGNKYLEDIGEFDVGYTKSIIEKIEFNLEIQYTDQSLALLPGLILVNKRRFDEGHQLSDSEQLLCKIEDTKEYELISKCLGENLPSTNNEKAWIILQFLTSNIQDATTNLVNDNDLVSATKEMIWLFEEKTCINVSNKQRLLERLTQHLRPAFYRVKYQLNLKNDWYLDYINKEESYRLLFEVVKEIIYPIECLTTNKFNDNELALITFFFGAELLNQGISLRDRVRAVVVCTNGVSISKILNHSLKELFPEIIFLKSFSIREFNEYEGKYTIVFSTIPVETSKKVFLISPLMTDKEKKELQKQVYTYLDIDKYGPSISKLLNVIKRHSDIHDEKQLIDNLEDLIYGNGPDKQSTDDSLFLPSLLNYLNKDRIQFIESVEDWKEAIRLASLPLLKEKKIKSEYIQTLIDENDSVDTYSFLGQFMAIPHSDKPNQIISDGFSMLILKESVMFENKHRVKIIVPLAIKEKNQHLKAILQLQKIAENCDLVAEILKQDQSDEVMRLIEQGM